jgi:tetratricopeptide (TPR) repeat protein
VDEAVEQIDMAIARERDLGSLYRFRALLLWKKPAPDRPAALRDLERAAARERPDSPARATCLFERGLILHETGQYAEAVRAYDAALAIRPEDDKAHFGRGAALFQLKDFKEAARAFDAAVKAGRQSADVYRLRAHSRAKLGDQAGAVEDFTRALALRPDEARLWTERGLTYLLAWERVARKDFDEAIRLNPDDAQAYLGRAALRLLSREFREAQQDADQAARRVQLLNGAAEKARLLHDAARVHAQVVGRLEAAAATDAQARATRLGSQRRAPELLRQAIDALPPAEREKLVDAISIDPELKAIRSLEEFIRLRDYARPKK